MDPHPKKYDNIMRLCEPRIRYSTDNLNRYYTYLCQKAPKGILSTSRPALLACHHESILLLQIFPAAACKQNADCFRNGYYLVHTRLLARWRGIGWQFVVKMPVWFNSLECTLQYGGYNRVASASALLRELW